MSRRTRKTQRFVQDDRIGLDLATNRLHISTGRSITLVNEYRRLVGKVFFDDEQHFGDDQDGFFDVLAAAGRSALEAATDDDSGPCRVLELSTVVDGVTMTLRGRDALEGVERLNIDLPATRLLGARFLLGAGATKGIRVSVRRGRGTALSVTPRSALRTAQAFLSRVAAQRVRAELTLWTLSRGPHPTQRWRDLAGDEVFLRRLAQSGALVEAELENVMKGGVLHEVVKHDGVAATVPSSASGMAASTSTPSEVAGYRLDPIGWSNLLLAEASHKLAINAAQRKLLPNVGAVFLGTFQSDNTYGVALQYAGPHPDAAAVVAEAAFSAGAERTVLLVPPGCVTSGATKVVVGTLQRWDSFPGGVRQIARALALKDALLLAPPGTTLVIDLNKRRLWWADRELNPNFSEREWRLLAALARAPDQRLLHEPLVSAIGAEDSTQLPSAFLKSLVFSFKNKLTDDMSLSGKVNAEIRDTISSYPKGYQLGPVAFCDGALT